MIQAAGCSCRATLIIASSCLFSFMILIRSSSESAENKSATTAASYCMSPHIFSVTESAPGRRLTCSWASFRKQSAFQWCLCFQEPSSSAECRVRNHFPWKNCATPKPIVYLMFIIPETLTLVTPLNDVVRYRFWIVSHWNSSNIILNMLDFVYICGSFYRNGYQNKTNTQFDASEFTVFLVLACR